MSFISDLQGGIKQVTDVVEDVGDLTGAVGDVFGTRGYGGAQPGASLNATEIKEGGRIQTKITNGQGLTDWEIKNVNLLTQKGFSFSYPMEFMGGGAADAGIQTVGLTNTGSYNALQAQNTSVAQTSPGGLPVPFWKGPGGALQMPWSDPRIPEYLKQFALDDAYLRSYVRAPRGYVIVRDASGRPFAVLRQIARQIGIWRPAAKPPISATDWKNYKRNKAIEKKLIKIARPAMRAHSRPSSTTTKRRK